MAKNDFFPIVYRILAALYKNLKEDRKNDKAIFEKELYDVPQNFMNYIIKHLIDEKFIENVNYKYYNNNINFFGINEAIITPKGIEYLQENTMMNKAKIFLKDIKEAIPFL